MCRPASSVSSSLFSSLLQSSLGKMESVSVIVDDPKKVFETSYAQVHEALRALVKRAIRSGDIRKDLDPLDLLRALVGVANVATSPDWQQSARRLVDILITGSRPNGRS